MKISVIMGTRNRAGALKATLPAMAGAIARSPVPVEVLLVDNGSTDDTQAVMQDWAKSVDFPVKVFLEPRPGVSFARNMGIKNATGDVLFFTDDDCHLNPDFFAVLARYYENDPVPTMRGGRVELGDPQDLPFTIKLDDHVIRMDDVYFSGGMLLGCNMAVHRKIIDAVHGFDERIGPGTPFRAAEDTDFIHRIYRAGFPVEYVPDLTVKHFHGRRDPSSIVQLNSGYHLGNGALYAKHITDLKLWKHFYWDLRKCLYEMRGGEMFNKDLGLSYKTTIAQNLKGMAMFGWLKLKSLFG